VPARLEALAALGGLSRASLHSQLAAAVQAVLHVRRGRDGTRRLDEIAVLRREGDGPVRVVTAWHADTGSGPAADLLQELLSARDVA
jgi:pilus assembly protein CpaF